MADPILVSDLIRNMWLPVANRWRQLRKRHLDYVVLRLGGPLPERTARPLRRFPLSLLPWPSPPLSVEAFERVLERLAGDPRVRGVVLLVSGLSAAPAQVESLRQALARFRASGKAAVAWMDDAGLWSYLLACACDQILAPESASVRVAGFWSETVFLKDTLALAGIEADFEAIAEYKVSPDTFRRSEMSEPHRDMMESLLDSLYDHVIDAIAEARGLTAEQVRALVDRAPLTAGRAFEAGLLDGVCYEDELRGRLGEADAPAVLVPWAQARRRLIVPRRWYSRRRVGLIAVEGLIVSGSSRGSPFPLPLPLPLPTAQAGSDTVIQQLRAAARDSRIAAVVLLVDSPGGSALASDLIEREVEQLRQHKPVVVYMSNRAASGGYYLSAPANAIVAQATTLTGSIGIWGGKFVTRGLWDRLHASREVVSRGQAAGLYSDGAPFSDAERATIRAELGAGYARFKRRVAAGRAMDEEKVEALARGRVWTGEQAVARGLVDALGGLHTAAEKARALAGLDPRRLAPLVPVPPPRGHLVSGGAPTGAGEWLAGWHTLLRARLWALAPWQIEVRER